MKSVAILAALLGSAAAFAPAAFAPAATSRASTALHAFEDELGVQPPLGFFDPLGLLKNGDETTFNRLRYVEIKHGRVAMLGFLGNILPRAGVHFKGAIDLKGDTFDSFPNGLAALYGPDAIPRSGYWQIIIFVALLEIFFMKENATNMGRTANPPEFPGDFRNVCEGVSPLDFGWDTLSEEKKYQKRAIELNNGRAAMMGILGLCVHEQLNAIGMVADLPIIGVLK